MADEQHSEEVQRRTAKRRAVTGAEPVLSLLKGETTAADAGQRHGLNVGALSMSVEA